MSTLASERCVTVAGSTIAVPSPVAVSRPSWSDVLELARGVVPYLGWGPAEVAAALRACEVSSGPDEPARALATRE